VFSNALASPHPTARQIARPQQLFPRHPDDAVPATQVVKLDTQAVNGGVCLLGELPHLVVLRECLLAGAIVLTVAKPPEAVAGL
jgi:hypothetical protein